MTDRALTKQQCVFRSGCPSPRKCSDSGYCRQTQEHASEQFTQEHKPTFAQASLTSNENAAEQGLTEKLRTIDAHRLSGGGWPVSAARVKDAANEIEQLRTLLRDSVASIDKAADADCVCSNGPQRCKYCAPHRALRDRIDAALSGDSSALKVSEPNNPRLNLAWQTFLMNQIMLSPPVLLKMHDAFVAAWYAGLAEPRASAVETTATPEGVLQWAVDSFGPIARNRDERAARLAEEAMEVAQAEGVPLETIKRIAERIYSRPVGDLGQEVGGLGITLYALAANCDLNLLTEIEREWKRVLSKPSGWWQRKHAEKVAAGTADLSPVETSDQCAHENKADVSGVLFQCELPAGHGGKHDFVKRLPQKASEQPIEHCITCGMPRDRHGDRHPFQSNGKGDSHG